MNGFSSILYAIAAGVVLQNAILARGFCTDELLRSTRTYKGIVELGAVIAVATLSTTFFCWIARYALSVYPFWHKINWIVYFMCLALTYILMRLTPLFPREKSPDAKHPYTADYLLYVVYSSVTFGIALISLATFTPFLQTMFYALGCCAGLTGAQMLILAGHQRLELSAVPKPFVGVPILMIYLGILSLAIYGLIGHQLPT